MAYLSLLMVDDSPVLLNIQKGLIARLGHQVTTATSGKEAIELAQRSTFNAILMDMQMPEMNGTQASIRMRELGIVTPIIALTGNDSLSDRIRCQEAGMNGFLTKPLQTSALQQELMKLGLSR